MAVEWNAPEALHQNYQAKIKENVYFKRKIGVESFRSSRIYVLHTPSYKFKKIKLNQNIK